MELNPQAIELNEIIRAANPNVLDLLSDRGKAIFFPKRGILAQTAAAKGTSINATIGTALEDDGSPMALESIYGLFNFKSKESFSYAPSFGKPEIRVKWKEMLLAKNPSLASIKFSLPVVTSALTHGLSMAGYLFVNPGDTIISPDYYWENYDLIFDLAYSGRIETFATFTAGGAFNVEGFRQSLQKGATGKKIVMLNFPNNPTGYTVTLREADRICEILLESARAGNSIVVLIDDAYFGLVFEEGIMKESIFTRLANAHERILAVKLDGPTKEDYVWGFRVGFFTFGIGQSSAELYGALEAKLAGAIRGNISNVTNPGQTMLLQAYLNPAYEKEKTEKFTILRNRYFHIKEIFKGHPEYAAQFRPLPCNSGYFLCVELHSADSEKVRRVLLDKFSTGIIAQGKLIRIAFSSTPFAALDKLFDNLYHAALESGS